MSRRVVTDMDLRLGEGLASFIEYSPSPFHAVREIRKRLDASGYEFLPESGEWDMVPGGKYYTIRNGSSVVALVIGSELESPRFQMAAAHTDSPTFKIKADAELEGPGPYVRLNTEVYGGTIDRSWLDRPLSLAGRVMVETNGGIESRLVYFDRDLLLIPSLAIHLDREVNKGGAMDRTSDIVPLASCGMGERYSLVDVIAEEAGVASDEVLSHELYLVNRQRPAIWGLGGEFISAPRIDDLQCVYAALLALLESRNPSSISVLACFDNEEVGSGTMRGACSTFLRDVLRRTTRALGYDEEQYLRAMSQSMLVSCDNAHAVHPNHSELYDKENRAWLNGGVVVKETASQRYMTNSLSRALFLAVCRKAGVPTQSFANRSDMPGGSTLGNLQTRQVSVHGVDVGLPQLAMHSAYETAGICDTSHLVRALTSFYGANYTLTPDDGIVLA